MLLIACVAKGQTNTFPSNGNVGIGTTTPNNTLDISGGIGFSNQNSVDKKLYSPSDGLLVWLTQSAAGQHALEIQTGSPSGSTSSTATNIHLDAYGNSYLNALTGYVGVGTVNPSSPLTVAGAKLGEVPGSISYLFNLYNTDGNGSSLNFFQLRNSNGTDWTTATTRIQQVIDATPMGYIDFNPPNGVFGVAFGGVSGEYMRIANGGNVGIGTKNPGANAPNGISGTFLEVSGNIMLTQNTGGSIVFQDGSTQKTAWTGVLCGGDYAESVDVTGERAQYEPGDVLAIDPEEPSRFVRVAEPYSTGVAGVYSTKPGVLGRRQTALKSSEEIPMAMVGIVPVKVSAENGSIKLRDLLVSSSIAGVAMKGTDRSRMLGAVIGKAMGTLDSGTGIIEVLVSLQ